MHYSIFCIFETLNHLIMKYQSIIKLVIVFISTITSSSCAFKLEGNYLTLVPAMSGHSNSTFDERGIVDSNNIPILRLASIYFYSDVEGEFVTLTYNNNYSETLEVSNKTIDKESVRYVLGNKHTLYIQELDGEYFVSFDCNSYEKTTKSGYFNTVLRYKEYATASSIETVSDYKVNGLPNFNQVAEYKKQSECVGSVKKVVHSVYDAKRMFGEDTLVLRYQYTYNFNKDGRIISKSYSPIYNNRKIRTSQTTYSYDKNGNLIEEFRTQEYSKIRVAYEYTGEKIIKQTYKESFDGKPYEVELEMRYKYDNDRQLKQVELYRPHYTGKMVLDGMAKFERTASNEVVMTRYSDDGEVFYKNYYDANNSIRSGYLRFSDIGGIYAPDKEYTPYINSTYKSVEVSYTSSAIKISLDGEGNYPEWTVANQDETYQFDVNCNQVFLYTQLVNRTDQTPLKYLHQNVMYSYVYDDKGNWTKRRGDIYEEWGDLDKENYTTLEIREIEYY